MVWEGSLLSTPSPAFGICRLIKWWPFWLVRGDNLISVLISISLIMSGAEHLFLGLLAVGMSLDICMFWKWKCLGLWRQVQGEGGVGAWQLCGVCSLCLRAPQPMSGSHVFVPPTQHLHLAQSLSPRSWMTGLLPSETILSGSPFQWAVSGLEALVLANRIIPKLHNILNQFSKQH